MNNITAGYEEILVKNQASLLSLRIQQGRIEWMTKMHHVDISVLSKRSGSMKRQENLWPSFDSVYLTRVESK